MDEEEQANSGDLSLHVKLFTQDDEEREHTVSMSSQVCSDLSWACFLHVT